jgi:hypothetical protein
VLARIRTAREQTLTIVGALSDAQLARTGRFGGYGPLTVRGLVHYLCSHDQQHLVHELIASSRSSGGSWRLLGTHGLHGDRAHELRPYSDAISHAVYCA